MASTSDNPPQLSPASTRSVSKLIVDYIQALGIPLVFGVPGGSLEPFIQSLKKSADSGGTQLILARSEAGAVHMADGYSRESGQLGVCCATSGPGATNMLTAVASAYADGTPLLVITAQTAMATFGRGAMQEGSCTGVNTLAMFQACTRYNTLVSHPAQLEPKLLAAISHALGPTPGPVHLSIPRDIFQANIEEQGGHGSFRAFFGQEVEPNRRQLTQLKLLLEGSRSGAIVIGHGCEGAIQEVLSWAEHKQWPIVTTPMGRGLVCADHPLFRGVFGTAGHESARLLLSEAQVDTILVIGANLDESATCGWDGSTILSPRMVHINANPEQLSLSYMAKFNLLGSPKLVFNFLNQHPGQGQNPPKKTSTSNTGEQQPKIKMLHLSDCARNSVPINPRRLFWHLSQQVDAETRLFADAGNSFFWALHYWQQQYLPGNEKNLFRIGIGFASMGWACPAAIGSTLAAPDKAHICFVGDGSLLMNSLEISVAKEHQLNILFVVLNNQSLGTVKHGQRLQGVEPTACELPAVNFAALATAMNIEAYRISSMDQLNTLGVQALFERPGPIVLDVLIDDEVVPPIGERLRALRMGDKK